MFNLNENNRIVMAQYPTDMRMGVNCLSGQVRMVGLDPSNGDVYIFVGKSRQVMKNPSLGARRIRRLLQTPGGGSVPSAHISASGGGFSQHEVVGIGVVDGGYFA